MKYKQFDIWLADLNPRFGTEAGKIRPVLIVQCDILNQVHPSVIVCPITTNIKKNARILRVNMQKGNGGLEKESAIMIDQIRAIDNKRLLRKTGELPIPLAEKVNENIQIVLGLK